MEHKKEIATARLTGIWYLSLAITGVLGFLVFHPEIFVSENVERTVRNLMEYEQKARIRLIFEILIILSQALTAIWFYKLFRETNEWAAFGIGAWGLMNSVAIMVSAISMGVAIEFANNPLPSLENKITIIQLLISFMSYSWLIGGLFFGLWLIPMGYIVVSSKKMPSWIGQLLILGGIGYILHTCIMSMGLSKSWVEFLTIPATIGEFCIIGYLLIFGIRPKQNR